MSLVGAVVSLVGAVVSFGVSFVGGLAGTASPVLGLSALAVEGAEGNTLELEATLLYNFNNSNSLVVISIEILFPIIN